MSKRPPRPQGYPWLTPYLVVKNTEASIDFYQRAFGFEKRMAIPGEDGKPKHVEMVYRDALIMFGPEHSMGEMRFQAPTTTGTLAPVAMYVYCDDVDAFFARAVEAGARAVRPPQNMFYGDRVCTLGDPDGYWWSFGTNVADFDAGKPS